MRSEVSSPSPTQRIKARALAHFDAVGIARLESLAAREHYEAWLAAGRHGEMRYLAGGKHRERRADPERILLGLQSVISVALCHEPTLEGDRAQRLGRIARYAAGEDYHRVMRDRMRDLARYVEEALPDARALWYSDTGAILERGWAERAGIGWVGKHTGLISPTLGSWFLLGEILVDHALDPGPAPLRDHCGTCRRCIDACPTGAIVGPRELDARLCISYLTIELRGPIPVELRPKIGDWIFGCDVCQEVCPWNRFAPPAREARLHARALEGWTLERFLTLDEPGFQALFDRSPIRRAQRSGFLRNVCVALGNRGETSAAPALMRTLANDPEPLVRAHAAWALGEIRRQATREAGATIAAALERASTEDNDEAVRQEATAAIGQATIERRESS